jgi:hypothetical protein
MNRRDILGMKLKLLLCGAALLVAGCASEQNPIISSGKYSYSYDLVPEPLPGITPEELARIAEVPTAPTIILPPGTAISRVNDDTP